MKEEQQLLQEMNADLQTAPAAKVIYLEGKTDAPVFWGLLGVPEPRDGVHKGVYVRALRDVSGMGSSSVTRRVKLAEEKGVRGIFGIVDGDGEPLSTLVARFDAPFAGPLFTWKSYSIENLLVKTGWPAAWGEVPDWERTLLDHAPYVALNSMYREMRGKLETLRLSRYNHPVLHEPLMTVPDVEKMLAADRGFLLGYDVATQFRAEVARFEAIVAASIDAGHALVDGKWLVNVFAPRRCNNKPDACREAWIEHARAGGGLGEVRALFERVAGREA